MTPITVHFSPTIIAKIGSSDTSGWTSAIRDWHHNDDPNKNFGRDVYNSPGVAKTWARHVHMAPDTTAEQIRWDRIQHAYRRTSDRLLVYSMDSEVPTRYGILLLAFLTPNGHDLLTYGASAAQRRDDWEDIAYTHQMTGNLPPGSISEI